MGITISYRGRLAEPARIEAFEDRLIDFALEIGGQRFGKGRTHIASTRSDLFHCLDEFFGATGFANKAGGARFDRAQSILALGKTGDY